MSRKGSLFLFLSLMLLALPVISYSQSANDGFNPSAGGGTVGPIVVQADGKILVGGGFTTIGGAARKRMARLNPDGGIDTGFNPDANNWVSSIAVQADGRVLIGGKFSHHWRVGEKPDRSAEPKWKHRYNL